MKENIKDRKEYNEKIKNINDKNIHENKEDKKNITIVDIYDDNNYKMFKYNNIFNII